MAHVENSVHYTNSYTEQRPPFEWTIAAEDLGGSYDWDFNDVVFTFTDVIRNLKTEHVVSSIVMTSGPLYAQSARIITVTPKAAGGTMPIYITYTGPIKPLPDVFKTKEQTEEFLNEMLMKSRMQGTLYATDAFVYEDKMFSAADKELRTYLNTNAPTATYVLGCELHAWLGQEGYETQYNVGDQRVKFTTKSVQFVIPTNLDVEDEDQLGYFEGLTEGSKKNQPLFGFSVLVDKENTLDLQAIPEEGFSPLKGFTIGDGIYEIGAPSDRKELTAPQMILIEGDWQWPTEYTNIGSAYPSFAEWIQKPDENTDWYTHYDDNKVTKK